MAGPNQSVERSSRNTARIFWACSALTLAVGAFLVVDVVAGAGSYEAAAWVGVLLSASAVVGLALVYAACATGRLRLDLPVGRLTVFQLTALGLVAVVGADILIPGRDTGGLAVLLPWGVTYWLHNLGRPPESGPARS